MHTNALANSSQTHTHTQIEHSPISTSWLVFRVCSGFCVFHFFLLVFSLCLGNAYLHPARLAPNRTPPSPEPEDVTHARGPGCRPGGVAETIDTESFTRAKQSDKGPGWLCKQWTKKPSSKWCVQRPETRHAPLTCICVHCPCVRACVWVCVDGSKRKRADASSEDADEYSNPTRRVP